MIRTLEEVRGSRLAVNIREVAFAGNELTVRLTVDGSLSTKVTRLEAKLAESRASSNPMARLYTAAEVGDAQASEAELVATPLRRRVVELERALADSVNREEGLAKRVEVFKAQAYEQNDRAGRVQIQVADQYREMAKRSEARADEMSGKVDELRQSLAARDHLLDKATRQLSEVMTAVHGMEISTALRTPWTSWREVDAEVLARTVHRVRTILGTAEHAYPEPTDPETSQA